MEHSRADINACSNWFCDILAPIFDTDHSLEESSNLHMYQFSVEASILKTGPSVNIVQASLWVYVFFVLGCHPYIDSCYHSSLYFMKCFG